MISSRWRKVLSDLLSNKVRTALVVLSVAVGVFAVGTTTGADIVMIRDLTNSFNNANPPHFIIYTDLFDDDLTQSIRNMKEVQDAEGRSTLQARAKIGEQEWFNIHFTSIPDFNEISVGRIHTESGSWPPKKREFLVERSSLASLRTEIGEEVVIETSNRKFHNVKLSGVVHDPVQYSTFFAGTAWAYVGPETMELLGGSRKYNNMHVIVAGNPQDKEIVKEVAAKVQNKIEKSGRRVYWTDIKNPGRHWADDQMNAMAFLLESLGYLTIFLSGFLLINTISSIITQQVRQIGIMKAIGGTKRQVIAMYLGMVLAIGFLALLLAVPLGALATRGLVDFTAKDLLNADVSSGYPIPPKAFFLEFLVAFGIPLAAALQPVIAGSKITVREALNSYGLKAGHGKKGFLQRSMEKNNWFSRPLILSLRNTFRKKGRLALTLITLTLGGGIFISVLSVKESLDLTVYDELGYYNYDISINLDRSYRIDQIEREAKLVPGVEKMEGWGYTTVRRLRPDKSESGSIQIIAPPVGTTMVKPIITDGRWLLPEDENAVVVNTDLIKNEPDINVGDNIIFKVDGRDTEWVVVGKIKQAMSGPVAYGNYPYVAKVTRRTGMTSFPVFVTKEHSPEYQLQVVKQLEERFKNAGFRVRSTDTNGAITERIISQFNVIVGFLLVMALILGIVGGIGLTGTMSINVMERTREIGVMRSIGASNSAVFKIFITEGLLIGILSWMLGTLFAMPMGKILSDNVGIKFTQAHLNYTFSISGALVWLVLVIILSALSSLLPAWHASRISVRDVLAYE